MTAPISTTPISTATGTELVGLIATATIFVEGAAGTPEAFTDSERDIVFTSVINAQQQLGRLAKTYSPNHLLQCSFYNMFQSVVIAPGAIPQPTNTSASPTQRNQEKSTLEGMWRPDAMTAAFTANGLTPNTAPGAPDLVNQFCNYLRTTTWLLPYMPRRAFIVFVTKFPTGWMAYVDQVGGERAIIQYDWLISESPFGSTGASGWGAENLDRVIAHEMGHLFGGLDEYAGCDVNARSGPDDEPNINCVNANPASVDCLMKDNTRNALCTHTPHHYGWVDTNGDNVVDAAPPNKISLSSPSGAAGDTIQISGRFLGETLTVVFTGVGSANFTIKSDTEIDVVVPQGSGNNVDVYVTTVRGVSSPSNNMMFSYA
jgi:hypothetical protein